MAQRKNSVEEAANNFVRCTGTTGRYGANVSIRYDMGTLGFYSYDAKIWMMGYAAAKGLLGKD